MKKLKRYSNEAFGGLTGGVCYGIAKYFNIDPTFVRILFGVLLFGYGIGLGIYILAWIIMPDAGFDNE